MKFSFFTCFHREQTFFTKTKGNPLGFELKLGIVENP
jgi:hypothetical protein